MALLSGLTALALTLNGAGLDRSYRSPDGQLTATIISKKQTKPYGIDASRIEIRSRSGRLLAERDHSIFPNQGLTVAKAGWTRDSRFFAYVTEESGGHQPWHHPSFFYSRRRDRFYSLERALYALDGGNGAVTGWMELQAPCTFLTSARFFGKSRPGLHVSSAESGNFNDRAIAIDLRWLERRLTPESLSTDARDRELLRRERMAER